MTKFLPPVATALRQSWKNYDVTTFKKDLTAGFIVSLIALPLAMALATAVGLPPKHGLHTAIIAGIIAALFGGSRTQVSGPTAAFVVIIAPILEKYGLHGLIWCQLMAGAMLFIFGWMRAGSLIRYIPHPVIVGFTAGIAVTIGTMSLNDFFGLKLGYLKGHYIEKINTLIHALPQWQWQDTLIGIVTLSMILLAPYVVKRVPPSILGIAFGTMLSFVFNNMGYPVSTLLSEFSYTDINGMTQQGVQPYPPVFHYFNDGDSIFQIPTLNEARMLFMPALLIATLTALESLLSATVADQMTPDKNKHDPNAELTGIGLANIFTGLATGIPATGAIARTSANIHSGAKTPMAAIIHSLFILLYVLMFAPYISYIPMAALAGLLIFVAIRMSHAKQMTSILTMGTKGEKIVLLGCFFATVFVDMVAGVSTGMILCALFMRENFTKEKRIKE